MLHIDADSVLGRLAALPDPRRREGRRYPLPALLGLVVLGLLHGKGSLRGAWVWAQQRWGVLWRPLGARLPHFPSYTTVRDLLALLDPDDVDRRLRPWFEFLLDRPLGGVSADGKVLRGSKRDTLAALHVVSLVAHDAGTILAQASAPGGDELAALLTLLREVPLAGRTRTMDAGLTNARVTQTIRKDKGDYVGVVKGNQPELLSVLDDWVAPAVPSSLSRTSSSAAGSARRDCSSTTQAKAADRQRG